MMGIVIVGGGGHGQVVADILLSGSGHNGLRDQPLGFVDDDLSLQHCSFLGLPVLGTIAQLPTIVHQAVIVAIGHNQIRRKIYRQLEAQGEQFISAHHPSALIGREVEIGVGTTVNSGVIINTGSRIGQNVILNTACSVDHHNQLGDHVHIAPGVTGL
jgi:sugar O-acyltransferase (sialic acid O-acetyltransferase NeuD family)